MAWREKYQTKKGTRYRVRWRAGGSKQHKKAGPLPSTANKIIVQVEDHLVQDKVISNPSKVSSCLKEYLAVMEKTVKPRTHEIARTSFVSFEKEFGNRIISEVKTHEIEKFKNRLLEFRKSNGINIVIRNLKTFFKFCLRSGYIETNTAELIEQFPIKSVGRFLSREELVKLYKVSPRNLRRAIFVLYNTGMRRGEFLGVTSKDILEHEVKVNGKTGPRSIPLQPKVKRVLLGIPGEWNVDKFEQAFRMAVKRAGIGRIRPHDLRHTFASAYLKSGGTLADLRLVGGWESLSALQIYARFQKNYLMERMVKVRL